MKREALEHIIRASGDVTDQYEFVIVGIIRAAKTCSSECCAHSTHRRRHALGTIAA
jgi:hypothetical protein